MNVLEFIEYTKKVPEEFTPDTEYCIVIGRKGEIYYNSACKDFNIINVANIAIDKYSTDYYNLDYYISQIPPYCGVLDYIVSKEKIICAWKNIILVPTKYSCIEGGYTTNINRFQSHSIELLQRSGILSKDKLTVKPCYDYHISNNVRG